MVVQKLRFIEELTPDRASAVMGVPETIDPAEVVRIKLRLAGRSFYGLSIVYTRKSSTLCFRIVLEDYLG